LPGFLKIINYYASINKGVSNKVLNHFSNIKPFDRPVFNLPENLDPYWVSGFVAGDGGFSIYVNPSRPPKEETGLGYVKNESSLCPTQKGKRGGDRVRGERLDYRFYVTQHSKDSDLIKLFIKFFNCGVVHIRSNPATPRCDFLVQDANSILEKIIPHFDSYPLLNLKQKDFNCFKESMTVIKLNQHLTSARGREGLEKIKNLSLEMNSNRLKSN
jgi:LAGLIDADG endonuclease